MATTPPTSDQIREAEEKVDKVKIYHPQYAVGLNFRTTTKGRTDIWRLVR